MLISQGENSLYTPLAAVAVMLDSALLDIIVSITWKRSRKAQRGRIQKLKFYI